MGAANVSVVSALQNTKFYAKVVASYLAAGKTPNSWLNGLKGEPSSKLIFNWPRSLRSEANGA